MSVKADRLGRNDPCPCGSGKKVKRCCPERLSRRPAPASAPPLASPGETIMFVDRPEGIAVRRIPAASALKLEPGGHEGHAAEDAIHHAAGGMGMPDFLLRAELRRTASGVRELGDGLMLLGDLGLLVQAKRRTAPSGRPEREAAWVAKQVKKALSQAEGSVRQLTLEPATLGNLRGRQVLVDGAAHRWLAVVVLDGDQLPDDVEVGLEACRLPHVVLTRRDWEFLFDQLKSAVAVGHYLERVAGEAAVLGEEPVRYYQLAGADAAATPDPVDAHLLLPGSEQVSGPLLSFAPTGTEHAAEHLLYRAILEDVAASPWGGDELVRLRLLAHLDGMQLSQRGLVGQALTEGLKRFSGIRKVQPGQQFFQARRVISQDGAWYCIFSVCALRQAEAQEWMRPFLRLRHHDHQQLMGASAKPDAMTVAVMLTPRGEGPRSFDTTVLAERGPSSLTEADAHQMRKALGVS